MLKPEILNVGLLQFQSLDDHGRWPEHALYKGHEKMKGLLRIGQMYCEGVVAPWCNPVTLQPEQSGGVGLSLGRAPPLERHDKGSRIPLGLLHFCYPSAWR